MEVNTLEGNNQGMLAHGSQHPGWKQEGDVGSWVRGSQYMER